MIGKTLAHYEIIDLLGKGGMGEVYRARDTKLGREVAIKVLPREMSGDPERVARFQREARTLATLQHPNIASIYGFEEHEGTSFLVMELVRGQDLQQALQAGRLSPADAVDIALQIATGLEAAHEQGIVHRDLKPANVKIAPDGAVKILDFGLARAYMGDPAGDRNLSNSPTITAALTGHGVILGTAAYMSPEQARGKPVDKRTDIFAFGAVVYEMLVGAPAFGGETVTDVLASIVKQEPDWDALPAEISPQVRSLVRRCLQKDPARRLHDIADARIELAEIASGSTEPAAAGTPAMGRRRPVLWLGAGILLGVVLAAAGLRLGKPTPLSGPAARLTMTLPDDARLAAGLRRFVAVPPDGQGIVYDGVRNGNAWIFRRDFDSEDPVAIPGTQDGFYPFFSPDGKWMGFEHHNEIVKVPVAGGTPISIGPAEAFFGVVWTREGYLVACTNVTSGLMKIPEAGGEATNLTRPAKGELGHWWPFPLPDGKHILFTCWRTTLDDASVRILSLDKGAQREPIQNACYARYLPTGHLVFTRGSALLAVPFDPGRQQLTGSPVVVVDSVNVGTGDGRTIAAFSKEGTLVYHPAVSAPSRYLARVEPGADPEHPRVESIFKGERVYNQVAVSPDGSRLALGIHTGTLDDIWVLDTRRAALTRLTFDGTNSVPVWTPNGREITFHSQRNGPYEIFQVPADRSGEERKLYGTTRDLRPVSWSPGHQLLFQSHDLKNLDEIWVLDTSGQEPEAKPCLSPEYDANEPRFSPDGKWMVYTTSASGRDEVYLQSYPAGGGRQQVSVNGGLHPMWSPDGRAIYYWSASKMLRVPIALTSRPEIGAPTAILDEAALPGTVEGWDNAPGGTGFIMILQKKGAEQPLRVVQNWFQEVERLAGSGG